MTASAGPEVDDIVGAANGFFVVLDHEDGVAKIAQISSGREKTPLSRWCKPMDGSSRT